MKTASTVLFFLLATITIYAQGLSPKDSIEISSIISDWNHAWNIKDYLLASKGYSNDAQFTNAFGDKKSGRKEIEQLLKEVFSLPFVMSGQSEITDQTVQTLSKDAIVVHTSVVRKGQKMPDGTPIPERKTTHLRVFQYNGAGWQIVSHLISDARDKASSKH